MENEKLNLDDISVGLEECICVLNILNEQSAVVNISETKSVKEFVIRVDTLAQIVLSKLKPMMDDIDTRF